QAVRPLGRLLLPRRIAKGSTSRMSLERALDLARAGRGAAEADLFEELRIPSVSTLPSHRDDVRRNCEWLAGRFRSLGMETSITDVSDGGHPVLRAERLRARPAPPPDHHRPHARAATAPPAHGRDPPATAHGPP